MAQKFPGYEEYCHEHQDIPKFVGSIDGKDCWVMKEPGRACAYAWNARIKQAGPGYKMNVAWWQSFVVVDKLESFNLMTQEVWDREGLAKLVDKPLTLLLLGGGA